MEVKLETLVAHLTQPEIYQLALCYHIDGN